MAVTSNLTISSFLLHQTSKSHCQHSTSQSPKILGHDEPLLQTSWRILLHRVPVGHQNKRLIEHLGRRVFAWAKLNLADSDHHNAHARAVGFKLGVFDNVAGSSVLKGRVHDVGIEGLYLIVNAFALALEQLQVVLWRCDDRAIDRDVCGDCIASRRVDVEVFEIGAFIYHLVVVVDEVFGSYKTELEDDIGLWHLFETGDVSFTIAGGGHLDIGIRKRHVV